MSMSGICAMRGNSLMALAQWWSIRTSNRKVVGSTPVGRTRNFFFPSMPVSLLNNTSFSLCILFNIHVKLCNFVCQGEECNKQRLSSAISSIKLYFEYCRMNNFMEWVTKFKIIHVYLHNFYRHLPVKCLEKFKKFLKLKQLHFIPGLHMVRIFV